MTYTATITKKDGSVVTISIAGPMTVQGRGTILSAAGVDEDDVHAIEVKPV